MPINLKNNPKKVQKIIISLIILYFIIFAINYTLIASSLAQSLGKIRIPHDFFVVSLDPEDPWLEASYVVPNQNLYDFTELSLNLSIDIEYEENTTYSIIKERIFSKRVVLHIPPFTSVLDIFKGGNSSLSS